MMADAFGSIIDRLARQEAAALDIYDEIIRRYAPGGAFEKRYVGELEKRKVREVGAETQQLISSGLYGTTVLGGLGRKWEEEVGGPERLKLEDIQMQRLSEAQLSKAGFITPDYGMIANLAAQIGQGAPVTRAAKIPATGRTYQSLQDYMKSFSPAAGGKSVFGPVTTTPATGAAGAAGRREVAAARPAIEEAVAAPTPEDDTAAYEGWAAEMRRRYPWKPVMPISRWRTRVKPKMGATYEQFAAGTYGQTS